MGFNLRLGIAVFIYESKFNLIYFNVLRNSNFCDFKHCELMIDIVIYT